MELQLALFDRRAALGWDPSFSGLHRIPLGETAWVDHTPGWVRGHQHLFDALAASTQWQVPEAPAGRPPTGLAAMVPADGPGHPVLSELSHALTLRYGRCLTGVELRLYRYGRDHHLPARSRARAKKPAPGLTAVLGLGTPRTVRVRPLGGQPARSFRLGFGDLLVVGSAQGSLPRIETPPSPRCHGAQLAVHFVGGDAEPAVALAAR